MDSTGQLKVAGCLTGTPDVFNYEGNERTWYCRRELKHKNRGHLHFKKGHHSQAAIVELQLAVWLSYQDQLLLLEKLSHMRSEIGFYMAFSPHHVAYPIPIPRIGSFQRDVVLYMADNGTSPTPERSYLLNLPLLLSSSLRNIQ